MGVKLPATLNIQLEYVFYTWEMPKFVGTIILSPSNENLQMLSAAIKTVVNAYQFAQEL